MICEYCGNSYNHNPRCPLYRDQSDVPHCIKCGDVIYQGEMYLENDLGEIAHYDCLDFGKDLVRFLGYKVKEMDWDEE